MTLPAVGQFAGRQFVGFGCSRVFCSWLFDKALLSEGLCQLLAEVKREEGEEGRQDRIWTMHRSRDDTECPPAGHGRTGAAGEGDKLISGASA